MSGIVEVKRHSPARLKLGGRYEIVDLLERGGTSEVYLAIDTHTAARVVIKRLKVDAALDPQHRERFVTGARSTMAIEHPAVGRVFSVETPTDAPPYLIMEALHGESLAAYLEREGKMPQPMALALAREAASGLVAAHDAGIIHRDIKPGNLFLLGPRGAPRGIRVIDFGLSKDLRVTGVGPSSVNLVLGTAQYMAPEQVLADPIDARTDVYAFGAVLFRMLTGQLPFDLDAGADLFSHQIFTMPAPPSWLLEDVDPRLERVILRCMRKRPENRYATMQELLAALDAIASEPWATPEESPEPKVRSDPDVYVPRNSNGRCVAEYLARQFGIVGPPALVSRTDAETADTLDSIVWVSLGEMPPARPPGR